MHSERVVRLLRLDWFLRDMFVSKRESTALKQRDVHGVHRHRANVKSLPHNKDALSGPFCGADLLTRLPGRWHTLSHLHLQLLHGM